MNFSFETKNSYILKISQLSSKIYQLSYLFIIKLRSRAGTRIKLFRNYLNYYNILYDISCKIQLQNKNRTGKVHEYFRLIQDRSFSVQKCFFHGKKHIYFIQYYLNYNMAHARAYRTRCIKHFQYTFTCIRLFIVNIV